MERLILFTALICIVKFSFSQTDYRNGYVITNDRDTLFGLVDYRENTKAYKSCDFMVSKSQNTITYEPKSIIAYGFKNDKFFKSREVSIKDQPSQVVFLEVIVSGFLSLYKFENTYFIEKGNDGLQQLINETKEVFVDGKGVPKKTNQHISTINILVFDCAEVREVVQKIRLDEKALTKLVEDYNKCKGEPSIIFKAKKPWTRMIIGMTGGLNISQLNFSNTNPGFRHLSGGFEVSKSPLMGASLDILSPRLSERISFHCDILYLTSKYYNSTVYNSSSIERNYATIELHQIKIPIGIRYALPKRKFTPYFNAGVSTTIHFSPNSKWVQEVESNGVVNTYENKAIGRMKNNQFGLWGGCGLLKSVNNKINAFLELRYEQTDGIVPFSVDSQVLNSELSNFQVLIGIRTK